MTAMATPVRYRAGVPVYRYRTDPEVPPVSVLRFDAAAPPGHGQSHIHDFPVLVYVERAGHAAVGLLPAVALPGTARLGGSQPPR